ncbi:MAG: LysM peptidoglycan-binding domain-containing protein [Gammaproteobacteria bacterium]|jgi:membrane-bound lytic murein transglycosylase D
MFPISKPLPGDRNLLAYPLFALLVAGCANLQPAPDAGGADAEPIRAQDAGDNRQQIDSRLDAVALASAGSVYVAYDFDFESQLKMAETEAAERQRAAEAEARAEAEIVAAIKADLEATRKKHDAWLRLQQGMQLSEVHNERVNAQLKWFVDHPGYMQRVMERARPILPFVLDELEARNLPSELALLPIVESAYQAFAYSHGRASGMWQIIPSTGRFLGLKQNWWYDGRRDIIESTRAAINYLQQLSQEFDGDWELALAAYNAGPGRIRSAVRYNRYRDRPTDFWSLTRIRKETQAYVPKMFALKEMFTHPEKYQLDLLPINNQVSYEIVELDGQIDLALAADLAGISVNQLYQLNPAFNRWATAPDGPHRLLLPRGKADHFRHEVSKVPSTKRINWVRHKIKSGETLSEISRHYRTSVALIREVNNIRGSHIRAGKYLMVPTATKSLRTYTLSASSRLAALQNTDRGGTRQEHIVRPGQSLWSISRSYGVTTRALAKWNGMAPIDTLQVGQKLVVWTSAQARKVSISQTRPSNALHALRYTVRKGDSLYLIADRFNVSIADIRRWNRLGKYLHPGQKIKLYVDITSQSG